MVRGRMVLRVVSVLFDVVDDGVLRRMRDRELELAGGAIATVLQI